MASRRQRKKKDASGEKQKRGIFFRIAMMTQI
jgi:hypothetical protein